MAYANRSRLALSPIPQNRSTQPSAASLTDKAARVSLQSATSDRTRRSILRAKAAHAASRLLRSPSPRYDLPVVVELPLVAQSSDSMQSAHIRTSLKRKKRSRNQLATESRSEKYSDRSSTGLCHLRDAHYTNRSSTSSRLSRTASLSARKRTSTALNPVTSPHLPRDKPSSSPSEHSDWSSVVSISPSISRASPSGFEELEPTVQSRPRIQTRRSSRNSLHRTLDGMSLEDTGPVSGLGFHRSTRYQSRSRSRQSSSGYIANDADPLPSPSHSRHATHSSLTPESDPSSSSSSTDMDDDEAEHARLISSAPTWQLHRLRKDELIQLSVTAGSWDVTPTQDQLELLTKQDLVNRIITHRSRLDRSQACKRQSSASGWKQPRQSHVSETALDQQSEDDFHQQDDGANGSLWMRSSTRRVSQRLIHRFDNPSSSNSPDGREADLTDVSNEAGGEETEAEPQPLSSTRQVNSRAARYRSKPEGTLRRMDSSTFDELEPVKAHQAPRRQLRDKTSLRGASGRRLRRANGSEGVSASTSSSIFGGRSSRASNASHSPFVQRHQLNVFVASSPIRTRSRTARLTMGVATRRKAGMRDLSAADAAFPALDPMATPKLGNRRPQRTRKAVKFHAGPPSNNHDEDEWMEDASSGSEVVSAALQCASAQAFDGADERAGHHGVRRALRPRRLTADSDTSLLSIQPCNQGAWIGDVSDGKGGSRSIEQDEADDMDASDDDAPTPTKFRKLRNGKLRLDAASSRTESDALIPGDEQGDDVDMISASEATGRGNYAEDRSSRGPGRNKRTESPESDAPASGSPENAMMQPSYSTLARLKKHELEGLCLHREIDIHQEDKKANLIKKLLDWHLLNKLEVEETDNLGAENTLDSIKQTGEDEEADDDRSDVSAATATAEHAAAKATQRTPTRRRDTRAANNAHPATTDSDQPLLLRARGKTATSDKLPTPPLTSNNEEANPPQAGDGVDELNGLDLESLNLTDKEIHPSKLEKLEKIGSGGFKDVYVGKYRISKTRVNKVAIADIRDQLTEMDIKELSLLRDLRHENIVRFIGVSIPEDPRHVPCMIVSELCSNGDLFDYIRNTPAPCDAEVFRILLETARGLEYLHTRTPAIIHRDCKSTNVLITRRRTAKINDFGLARVKNTSRSMMRSLVGTVNWQAVELWVPKPHYNEKVDVWSAAMTFWEVLQWHQPEKKYPFQGMNEHQIYQDVGQKKQRPYTGFIRRQFGGEIVDLLDRMWDQTPKNRPSMTEVCNELEALVQIKKEAAVAPSGRGKA